MALCNYQFDFIAGGIVSMLKAGWPATAASPSTPWSTLADSYLNVLGEGVLQRNLALAERPS